MRGGFGEILKKSVSWDETYLREDGWFSLARRDLCGGCHTCWWGRWKSQNRKIVPLSPYVEEPLNSKVIKKSFVPEQRTRSVIFEFWDSYVLSLWTFDVRFTHSHVMTMVHIYTADAHTHQYIYTNPTCMCQWLGRPGFNQWPGRVIPKTKKMVLDAFLLNTQHYKVRIKGKVEQSRERTGTLSYTSV